MPAHHRPLPSGRPGRPICVSCRRRAAGAESTLCAACEIDLYMPARPGPACEVCGIGDPRVLVAHRTGTLCANHAAIAGARRITLAQLIAECRAPGDNRSGRERRMRDRRAQPDRRRRSDPVAVDQREILDRRGFLAQAWAERSV